MPVPALELRPRGAIAIVDSAVRLCARRVEVWSLTLPGGALVALAVTLWVDAAAQGRRVTEASALLALSWFARALCQGAACDWVERFLVAPEMPTLRSALRTALAHAPTLFIATTVLLIVNAVTLPLTLGLSFFFFSSHVAAYAVAPKELGHPLAIHATCSRALGGARTSTLGVRVALGLLLFVALNLHIAANFLIYMGRKLAGLELVFAQRYASLDNVRWDVAVLALAFALVEPVRAAAAALLVVDGRVRQDGVDLQTALEQLPARARRTSGVPVKAAALALGALALGSAGARAQERPALSHAQIEARLLDALDACSLSTPALREQAGAVRELGPAERSALSRFLGEIEALAYDQSDCETLGARMEGGLAANQEARDASRAEPQAPTPDPAGRANEILARPEFAVAPPALAEEEPEVEEAAPDAAPSWWQRFKDWLRKKLEEWLRREPKEVHQRPPTWQGGGDWIAGLLVILLVAAVVVVAAWILLRRRERRGHAPAEVEVISTGATESPESAGALARPPEGWAHLADELAAHGRFRDAARHLYLAVLSHLHREGAIDYDASLSNWDYLRRFKGKDAWRASFRELTFRFDWAFYGHAELGADGYGGFRGLCEPILRSGADAQRAAG